MVAKKFLINIINFMYNQSKLKSRSYSKILHFLLMAKNFRKTDKRTSIISHQFYNINKVRISSEQSFSIILYR